MSNEATSANIKVAAAPAATAETANKEDKKDEKKEEKKEEPKEEKKEEKKGKRTSIFGNFFHKTSTPSQEKTEKEASAPAEDKAVSNSAPQLDNPVEEAAVKPINPESVTAPAEGEAAKDKDAAETPAAEAATTPKEKRRTSFFGAFGAKKEKKADTPDNDATDGETKAKSNKLGGIFRKPSKAVKLDKEEPAAETEAKADKTPETKAEKPTAKDTPAEVAEEAPKPAEAAAPAATEETKNVNVATTTPVQAAA